jgi:hypothetical protein
MDTTPRPRATHGSQGNSVLVVAVALAVFVAAVIAFALCDTRSSEPKDPVTPPRTVLDHTAVEHMIEAAGYTSVVCNSGVNPAVLVRLRFACLADGDQHIVVTILNDNGDYVWAPTS